MSFSFCRLLPEIKTPPNRSLCFCSLSVLPLKESPNTLFYSPFAQRAGCLAASDEFSKQYLAGETGSPLSSFDCLRRSDRLLGLSFLCFRGIDRATPWSYVMFTPIKVCEYRPPCRHPFLSFHPPNIYIVSLFLCCCSLYLTGCRGRCYLFHSLSEVLHPVPGSHQLRV